MKTDLLRMNQLFLQFIEALTDEEYQSLLEGRGEISFKPVEEMVGIEEAKEPEDVIKSFQTKPELEAFLNNFKKAEVVKIAEKFNIRVLRSESKKQVIQKIVDLLIGTRERQDLFKRMKLDHN
jgi:hypothetical protein